MPFIIFLWSLSDLKLNARLVCLCAEISINFNTCKDYTIRSKNVFRSVLNANVRNHCRLDSCRLTLLSIARLIRIHTNKIFVKFRTHHVLFFAKNPYGSIIDSMWCFTNALCRNILRLGKNPFSTPSHNKTQ